MKVFQNDIYVNSPWTMHVIYFLEPGLNVARGSRTRGSNVAFGSLRPFGPGSNVARGSRTRSSNVAFGFLRPFGPSSYVARGSRTRGSNVAIGSLRPFGPGSNVARGSRTQLSHAVYSSVYKGGIMSPSALQSILTWAKGQNQGQKEF